MPADPISQGSLVELQKGPRLILVGAVNSFEIWRRLQRSEDKRHPCECARGGTSLSSVIGDMREGRAAAKGTSSVISAESWNRFSPLIILQASTAKTSDLQRFFFCSRTIVRIMYFWLMAANLGLIRALQARTELIYRHLSEVLTDILEEKTVMWSITSIRVWLCSA